MNIEMGTRVPSTAVRKVLSSQVFVCHTELFRVRTFHPKKMAEAEGQEVVASVSASFIF